MFARQGLAELRNEQQLYRAALVLVAELEKRTEVDNQRVQDCVCAIVEKASCWPGQWRREQQLRMNGLGWGTQPLWSFGQENLRHLETWRFKATRELSSDPLIAALGAGPDPIEAAQLVICDLINAFPSLVYPWGGTAVEAPHWDLTGGIRPLLYYVLKLEHLQASGIAVCDNKDCRELFEIERAGQRFCGAECSQRQRQREYWASRGKKLRNRRRKHRHAAAKKVARKGR